MDTKNDLSADVVRLDYQTMLSTAAIAYSYALRAVEARLGTLQSQPTTTVSIKLETEWFARDARALELAGNMLHTLEKGLIREIVEVVRPPSV